MKKNILVIDDEKSFCEMVKINLEEEEYAVDIALNAEEGYEKIKTGKYDIIFLDILMPKVEGHVALEEIKKICDTPVVMLSAYLPKQNRDAILEAGARGCLEKPVDLEQIIQTVKDVVG